MIPFAIKLEALESATIQSTQNSLSHTRHKDKDLLPLCRQVGTEMLYDVYICIVSILMHPNVCKILFKTCRDNSKLLPKLSQP